MKYTAFTFVFVVLFLCSCLNNKADVTQSSDVQTEDTLRIITEDMAFEGVNNYCHSAQLQRNGKQETAYHSTHGGNECAEHIA